MPAVTDAPARLRVRVESTRLELVLVRQGVVDWLARCRRDDSDGAGRYIGRHKTQLEAIESVLLGAADTLLQAMPEAGAADAEAMGALYDACRDHDLAIVWLRRLWRYFADRLDQRADSAPERALLIAADEVIWSCHRNVLQRAKQRRPDLVLPPPPLAYLSADYSPAAIESGRPLPSELDLAGKASDIPGIAAFLARLPLPLLRLPPWCNASPWWLVFIGHEVGHHLLHDLRLARTFADGVEAAARVAGQPGAATRWQGWAEEIFADLVSLLTMGPVALWAMAELEWAPRARMLRPSARYPAPALRLALMRRAADRLSLGPVPPELDAALDAALAGQPRPASIGEDLAVLPIVLDFALGTLDDVHGRLGTLAELTGFDRADFAAGGDASGWTATLSQPGKDPVVQPGLRSARLLAAAGAEAWRMIHDEPDDAWRAKRREALRQRLLDALPRSGPPGVRAALVPPGARPGEGQTLAEALLAASRAQRETAEG